jgi:hypothetical protein
MARYYELDDDMITPGRWHLGDPVDGDGREVDPWQFDEGRRLPDQGLIRFQLRVPGKPLDFSLDTLAIAVVHQRVVKLFERLGTQPDVQFVPVEVEGQQEPWFVLNALHLIPCIDNARSTEVQFWKPEDERPDKLGQYRSVFGMRIDSAKVGNAQVFRTWGWSVALIVSERIKQAMEAEGISGTKFTEV